MKISFAICTHNEGKSILNLVYALNMAPYEHEIVILDDCSTDEETKQVLEDIRLMPLVTIHSRQHTMNFADQKNHLTSLCTGDYIVNLDADERLSERLIQELPMLLKQNPEIQVFFLPRINEVPGLDEETQLRWGWTKQNVGDETTGDIWAYQWPDYQGRIYKNIPSIQWANAVHEQLVGFTTFTRLPEDWEYAILHQKSAAKQKQQNMLYNELLLNK
jgi:glycosyltransferase involved in cell wall biosynthesis